MKKLLNLLILLALVMGGATSCRDDDYDYKEVYVAEYKAAPTKKKGEYRYLYYEPSYSSGVAGKVPGDAVIGLQYSSKSVGGELWYELGEKPIFKNDRVKKGWIPAKEVVKCGSGTIDVEVTSRAQKMKKAEQPIAHFILSTKEQIREVLPLDDYAVYIAALYSLLICGNSCYPKCQGLAIGGNYNCGAPAISDTLYLRYLQYIGTL